MSGNLDVYLKSTNYKIIKNNIDKSEKYMNGDYKNYTRKFWYIVEFDYKNVIKFRLISKNHKDLHTFLKKNKKVIDEKNTIYPKEKGEFYVGILNNNDISLYEYYFINKSELLLKFIKDNIKDYNNKYLRLSNCNKDIFKKCDINKKKIDGEYFVPYGNWFSCGIEWINFIKNFDKSLLHDNLHIISIKDNKRIKKISNINQLKRFTKKYYNKKPDNFKNIINWKNVEKDYDGLIICPYLKNVLNKNIEDYEKHCITNLQNFCRQNILDFQQILFKIMGSDITKNKYDLQYEWHRAWDVASGVVWNNEENIVSIKLYAYWDGNNWIKA